MGLFNSINVVGKNYKKYDNWEQAQADERAKKEWLAKNSGITEEQEADIKHKAETIIRATEIMDAHSENNCENMEQATTSLALLPNLALCAAQMPLTNKLTKKMTAKIQTEINENKAKLANNSLSSNVRQELNTQLLNLEKKLKNTTKKAGNISAFSTYAAILLLDIFFIIWGTSKQKEASRIGRFQAKQNELRGLDNFVNYTPEQLEEAQKIAKTLPDEKKEKNNMLSSINEFRSMQRNKKGYKNWLAQRDPLEIEKLKNRDLTPEQIKKGNEDKEIIVDTVKEINIKAEEYSENLENAYDTIGTLNWLLAIPVGFLANKVMKFLKASKKATAAVTFALPSLLAFGVALKGTIDQKEASRVGRYQARKDLLRNPARLLAYTDEQMESAKDINAPKQKKGMFNKLGQSFKFLQTYGKDKREYKQYKKTTELEKKKLQKAFKQIKITDEQRKEAENLQKNVFIAFDEVDEMSQKYSEDIEAGCEIVKEGLSTVWTVGGILGTAVAIAGISKGKIRLIKPANKIANFIFDKKSGIRKGINELTKAVTSKGKEKSSEFQRAVIKRKTAEFLEKPENTDIKKSAELLFNELEKLRNEVLSNSDKLTDTDLKTLINNILDKHLKQTRFAKWGRNLLSDIGKIITRKNSEKFFGKELTKEELKKLKLDFSYDNYKTLINTSILGSVPIFGVIFGVPYAFNAWLTNIQKKAGKIGVMKAMDNIDDPRVFAPGN